MHPNTQNLRDVNQDSQQVYVVVQWVERTENISVGPCADGAFLLPFPSPLSFLLLSIQPPFFVFVF